MDEPAHDRPPVEDPVEFSCPYCGQVIADAHATAPPACPHCFAQLGPVDEAVDVSDPETESEPEPDSRADTESELSELRIRQFSVLRRTAYRTRSYFIIGTLGSFWLAVGLVVTAVKISRGAHHWTLLASSCVLFSVGALIGAYKFGCQVARVQAEIDAALLARQREDAEAAKQERDFSLLSDGSQHARNLERMFEKTEAARPTHSTSDHTADVTDR